VAAPAPNPRVPFQIAFEDDDVIVAVKEPGIVTRPGRGHDRDSLLNGLIAREGDRLLDLGERRDYGLLHRLDRATSGLVAVARTALAYDRLRDAFAGRRVEKLYLALVRSEPPRPAGSVRVRLKEARRQDHKVAVVDARGEEAITHWKTLAVRRDGCAVVACRIETGRLHQIRAHLAWLGCPLAADAVYGGPRAPDGRGSSARAADREILLHAWRLRFPHPRTEKAVLVETPPPAAWTDATRGFGTSLAAILRRATEVGARR
jgi:23S rRNA pseudouridine1911/1915/1917 synthase